MRQLDRQAVTQNGQLSTSYSYAGEVPIGVNNRPDFPVVIRYVLIPPQSGVEVKITSLNRRIERDSRVSLFTSDETADRPAIPRDNGVVESLDGFWPPEIVFTGKPAIMRGYRMIPVFFNPLRYNSQTSELEIIEDIEIELDYTSDMNRVNLVENPQRKRPSRAVETMLSDLVINPPEPSRDESPGGSIAYVLGTGAGGGGWNPSPNWDAALEALTPLIEWRRRMGWTVKTIQLTNTNVRKLDEVKLAIKNAYDTWEIPPEYIVICGDVPNDWNKKAYGIAYKNLGSNLNYTYESDYDYGLLEGDDILPEAAVGRLAVKDVATLQTMVAKAVAYESDPFIPVDAKAGWQKRALTLSADYRSGVSTNDLVYWTKDLLLKKGYNQVDELTWNDGDKQPSVVASVNNTMANGIGFMLFRGHLYMGDYNYDDIAKITSGKMLPYMLIVTCNTGDYAEPEQEDKAFSEKFTTVAQGAIGAVGTGGSTHTAYNNVFCAGAIDGLYNQGIMTQGWVTNRGKIELHRNFSGRGDIAMEESRNYEAWYCHSFILNLMGDPAVTLFTDVPKALKVSQPGLRDGDQRYVVKVTDANDNPVTNAQVCLYRATTGVQLIQKTDNAGEALFTFDPGFLKNVNKYNLTVTGTNLKPYLTDVSVATAQYFYAAAAVAIDDDANGASKGNNDKIANPAERLELTTTLKNLGTAAAQGAMTITAVPHPGSERYITIVQGQANLDAGPAVGATANCLFVVDVLPHCPGGFSPTLDITAQVGDTKWVSSIPFAVKGAKLDFNVFEWNGNAKLVRNGAVDIKVELANTGTLASPEMKARLISFSPRITVVDTTITYPSIRALESKSGAAFWKIKADQFYINGSVAPLGLVVSADNGLADTIRINGIFGAPGDGEPFGPDLYGYICLDNSDDSWDFAPEYDWIEINQVGANTGLEDPGNGGGGEEEDAGGGDVSKLVNLPFEFQYYGVKYNKITVCSNGWASLGDNSRLTTSRNHSIPHGFNIASMLAPFWDDLTTNDGGKILTYHDEGANLFVIQWDNVKRLVPGGNGSAETFQIVLYDPRFYRSPTGDGDVKFQYKTIVDEAVCYAWDIPYSTVGVVSPDYDDGLQYSNWHELAPGAKGLADGRAILFTTMRKTEVGIVMGQVTDASTGEGLADVQITTNFGNAVKTDSTGKYIISDAMITGLPYEITAGVEFYNDSTLTGIDVVIEDTVFVNFGLLHPQFDIDGEVLVNDSLKFPDEEFKTTEFKLSNGGNGLLTFSSTLDFGFDAPERDKPFGKLFEFDVTNAPLLKYNINEDGDTTKIDTLTILGNKAIGGVEWVDSLFWVTGGGDENEGLSAKIYRFTRDGRWIDSLTLPWVVNEALLDIYYDGTYIYGGFQAKNAQGQRLDPYIYKFTPDGKLADSIAYPGERVLAPRCIAYDPIGELYYVSSRTGAIYVTDKQGNLVKTIELTWDGMEIAKYGLSWYPAQPDSLKLLIYAVKNQNESYLLGYDPVTEKLTLLKDMLVSQERDRALGITVSPTYDATRWVLITAVSNESDRVIIWELEPNTEWLTWSPVDGELKPGEDVDLSITVKAGEMPFGVYKVKIKYSFNASPGELEIPVTLIIWNEEHDVREEQATTPIVFTLDQNYPNPFNPSTRIGFSVPQAGNVQLDIWDANGRLVQNLANGWHSAGSYAVNFSAEQLPAGIYFYRLSTVQQTVTRKMVLLR